MVVLSLFLCVCPVRVLLAYDALFSPTDKDPKQPRFLKIILRVILGFIFLHLFVFSFTIVSLLRNFIDLIRLLSSPEFSKQKVIQGYETSIDQSKVVKDREPNDVGNENNKKGASEGKKAEEANLTYNSARKEEPVQAYKEKSKARIMRLTHPPSLSRSFATASDGQSKEAKDRGKGQDSKVEGDKRHPLSTKNPITRALSRLGSKASPAKETQTARKKSDLESNDEQGSRAVQGVAVD